MRKRNAVLRSITSSLLAMCMVVSVMPTTNVMASNVDTSTVQEAESKASSLEGTPSVKITTKKNDVVKGSEPVAEFNSKRILVQTTDKSKIDKDKDAKVLADYNGTYLLSYDTVLKARSAYQTYDKDGTDVQPDTAFSIASDDNSSKSAGLKDLTATDNPLSTLKEESKDVKKTTSDNLIALVDTGASKNSNVVDAVSMIGDDAGDDNGHGDKMVDEIVKQNPSAKILSIKALDKKGNGNASSVYAGIEYAIKSGAKIINLSLSGASSVNNDILKDAISDATKAGITVVGAAGNDNTDAADYIPGGIKDALIVGACNEKGTKVESSNYGETVDYFVNAKSTSYAAAITSGYVSKADGKPDFEADKGGLFFSNKYVDERIGSKASLNYTDYDKVKGSRVDLYKDGKLIKSLKAGDSNETEIRHAQPDEIKIHSKAKYAEVFVFADEQGKGINHSTHTSWIYTDPDFSFKVDASKHYWYFVNFGEQKSSHLVESDDANIFKAPDASNPDSMPGSVTDEISSAAYPDHIIGHISINGNGRKSYKTYRASDPTVDNYVQVKCDPAVVCLVHGRRGPWQNTGAIYDIVESTKGEIQDGWQWYTCKVNPRGHTVGNASPGSGYQNFNVRIAIREDVHSYTAAVSASLNLTKVDTHGKKIEDPSLDSEETEEDVPATGKTVTIKYTVYLVSKYHQNSIDGLDDWSTRDGLNRRAYTDLQKNGMVYTGSEPTSDKICTGNGADAGGTEVTFNGDVTLTSGDLGLMHSNVSAADAKKKLVEYGSQVIFHVWETRAPDGYIKSSGKDYVVNLSNGSTDSADGNFVNDQGAVVKVRKIDSVTKQPLPGATFILMAQKAGGGWTGRIAVGTSGPDGIVTFSSYDTDQATNAVNKKGGTHKVGDKLEEGTTYKVREETAPPNYTKDSADHEVVASTNPDPYTIEIANTPDQHHDGNIAPVTRSTSGEESAGFGVNIKKRNYHNPSYMGDLAGFRFRIQAGSHDDTVTTDANGEASKSYPNEWTESWSASSDTYWYVTDYTDDEGKAEAEAKCKANNQRDNGSETVYWSEADAAAAAQADCNSKASAARSGAQASVNSKSASVTVTEVSTPAKGGWLLDSTPKTATAAAGATATYTFYNKQRPPKVKTKSVDTNTGDHVGQSIDTTATINDTVNCTDLIEGHNYTITGTLSTGETISVPFTAQKEQEEHTMTFVCRQADRQNKTVYVTETIVDNVTKLTGKDGGNDDYPEQTVRYPRVGTTAIDNDTKDNVGTVKNDAKIVDTVRYANLWTNGTKYRIEGTAYDVSTKKALTTSSAEFTPSNKDGSQDLTFTLDTRSLGGHDVVIFEKLYYISNNKKVEIAHHEDWNDQGQTIHYPKVGTTALDEKTNRHDGLIQDTNTLIDTVHIENAVIGKTYTVTGKLYDQSNGKPLTVDGKEITATAQVTPTAKNVDVKVPFTFKYVVSLYGRNFVAFEDLIHNNIKVATHSEINDKQQTVYYPTAVGAYKEDYDYKEMKATGKYVAGATFKLFTKDGNTYHAVRKDSTGRTYRYGEDGYNTATDYTATTTEKSYARFDNLAVGIYYAHEAQAPDTYVQNDTYLRLDSKVGEVNAIYYHNAHLPYTFLTTGGRGTVRFYVIAGVAAAALAIALICKVKGKKKKVNTDKE